jgi:hypothetical protein
VGSQQRREDVLRRRLPERAGDRDDPCAASRAHGPADRRERRELVRRNECRTGAPRARPSEIRLAAADCDEQSSGPHAARVDLDTGHHVYVALQPAEAAELRER